MKKIISFLVIVMMLSSQSVAASLNVKEKAKMKVRELLKDPYSAKFENLIIGKDGFVCGSVNSKNSYGAYVGATLFVSNGEEFTYLLNSSSNNVVAKLLLESKCGL